MSMNYDYSTTILALDENAQISIFGEDEWANVTWKDGNPKNITEKQVIDKQAALQAEFDILAYSRNRQAEYPDWGSQLNKIYDDGLDKWKSEMVDPIKAKWPKDNSGPV